MGAVVFSNIHWDTYYKFIILHFSIILKPFRSVSVVLSPPVQRMDNEILVGGGACEHTFINVVREKGFKLFRCHGFGQMFKKTFQVPVWIKAIGLGGFNQAVDCRTGLSALRRVWEQPVLTSNHKRTDGIFNCIVIRLDYTVCCVLDQTVPLIQSIIYGLAQQALWGNFFNPCIKPLFKLVKNRNRTGLPSFIKLVKRQTLFSGFFFYFIKLADIF